jgi:hypothetical protein
VVVVLAVLVEFPQQVVLVVLELLVLAVMAETVVQLTV